VALVHLDVLYRTALRLTHHRAEADDLVQEACLRAYRSFDRFDPGTNCRAWLLAILRNAFLNRLRQAAREVLEAEGAACETRASAFTDPGPAEKSPEEALLQTILHGDLDRALRALPVPSREAVMLVDLEGLSYKEVAQVVGCPIGTVMSRLSRGRALLRESLRSLAREHGYIRESE